MTGSSDILADPIDVNQMVGNLTNAKVWMKQYEAGHLTFMWGKKMDHMNDVIEILKNDIY